MTEEKLRILKLLENGKISHDDAANLLETLNRTGLETKQRRELTLHIRVYKTGIIPPRANLNIPLDWAKFMVPFLEGKIKPKLADNGIMLDLEQIQRAIEAREPAKLVEIQSGQDRLDIFID